MKRKRFKITMEVKSPHREDNHEILLWKLSLLRFIRRWLRDDYAYRHHRPAYYYFEPIKFVKAALEDNCYYLSYMSTKNYYSPYFNIKDVKYYEEKL